MNTFSLSITLEETHLIHPVLNKHTEGFFLFIYEGLDYFEYSTAALFIIPKSAWITHTGI